MSWRAWLCLHLPWHRWVHSFWASRQAEVFRCDRCKAEWVMNHEMRAGAPWDAGFKAFYRNFGGPS